MINKVNYQSRRSTACRDADRSVSMIDYQLRIFPQISLMVEYLTAERAKLFAEHTEE
jgi:hypothetical protein